MADSRRVQLQQRLSAENKKALLTNKVPVTGKEPAKFRSLMVDCSDSVSTAILSETGKVKASKPAGLNATNAELAAKRLASAKKSSSEPTAAPASVPASLVTEATKAQSEWALLGRFEADVYKREQIDRQRAKAASKANQRDALDFQRAQSEAAAAAAREAAAEEAQAILADVERYKKEEAIKLAARRDYERQVKTEQEEQLAKLYAQREADLAKKKAEETEEVRATVKALEEEAAAKQRKKEAYRQEMVKTGIENDKRLAEKARIKVLEKEKDAQANIEYIQMLDAQDKAREEALKKMYEKAQARSAVAGDQVVKEAAAKKTAEEARMQKVLVQKEAEIRRHERRQAAAAKAATASQLSVLDSQLAERAAAKEHLRQEMVMHCEQVQEQDMKAKMNEAQAAQARRARNVENRKELEHQMEAAHARTSLKEFMNGDELCLNAPLLYRAKQCVN